MYVEHEMNVDEKDKHIPANQHVQIYNKMKKEQKQSQRSMFRKKAAKRKI